MDWLVTGTRGGKPGRWKLEAADESGARQKAVAGGVAVQDVRKYPTAQAAAAVPPSAAVAPFGKLRTAPEPSGPLPATGPESSDEPTDSPGPADREPWERGEYPSEERDQELPAASTSDPEQEPKTLVGKSPEPARGKGKKRWGIAAIAVVVLAGGGVGIYEWIHHRSAPPSQEAPTVEQLLERARAERVAQANIGIQFVSMRPAENGKYDITFAYKCLGAGMSVTGLNGRLLITDASGKQIDALGVFELFPQGLGNEPVRREGRWSLDAATAQRLGADASQLKVEYDPGE